MTGTEGGWVAAAPLASYETRVVDGIVEVRPRGGEVGP